jgi:hypothetical protein
MSFKIIGGAVTAIFVMGILYGYSGGTIPSVAVMIVSTVGATVFGIATLTEHMKAT